uniref:Uncharacterized protein n=1 Tax=Rhizophora mucronata TaxID=61149 RepID=A0A2P2L9H6_RHIMU
MVIGYSRWVEHVLSC